MPRSSRRPADVRFGIETQKSAEVYDFKAALNRPWEHGVTYLLVSNPSFTGADALNIRYPTLWIDGAGFSKLVFSIDGATRDERFRIYEVTGPPESAERLSTP